MFFNLSADQASLDTIEQRFKDSSRIKGTNFLVLLLAIIIASVGLNINSVPVIIGAMLISPLMGPIIGIGYFTVRKTSTRNYGPNSRTQTRCTASSPKKC